MSLLSQSRVSMALLLVLSLAISTSRAPAQVPTTNTFPPWPTRAQVKMKWDGRPMTEVEHAAESGDVIAQHYLGYCYTEGFRVAVDLKAGIAWYEKALRQNYLPSGFNLALLYESQASGVHDDAKALYYFQYTADNGLANSKVELARFYRNGVGVSSDPVKAFKLLEQAADLGNADAMCYLFGFYLNGDGVASDYAKAIQWLRKAVAAGGARGQCELAYQYEQRGIEAFPEFPDKRSMMREVFRLNALAANQGFILSQIRLAEFYLKGEYVEQDEVRALELMRNSSDRGSSDAMSKLAGLYAKGIGEPRDEHDRPFELLGRAVLATDDPERQKYWDYWAIIDRCETGLGTDLDLVAAAHWYCRAVVDNVHDNFGRPSFTFADKFDLSRPAPAVSFGNRNVSAQLRTVLSTYLRAAARQDAQAAIQLGTMYMTGKDAPNDAAKAWPWFTLASQYGAAGTASKISQAESGMTAARLEQARRQFPAFQQELQKVASAAAQTP